MSAFRKKPVVIEAMRYDGRSNIQEIWDWAGADVIYGPTELSSSAFICTLEGRMEARVGDWIIRGVQGEFYPCKPDIFEATYESTDGQKRYTHDAQNDVADFHQAMGLFIPCHPGIRNGQLRIDLIEEEAKETCDAIERGDFIEAVDGLCDLIYVAYGAAIEFGIDLAPFWNEVQRSNLQNAGGPRREDGKILKPEGWQKPDIEGVLRKEYDPMVTRGG